MPSATWTLAFLVTGFVAIYRYLITRWIISRATGHPQYFLAAAGGAVCFAISALFAFWLHRSPPPYVDLKAGVDVFLPYFTAGTTVAAKIELIIISTAVAWVIPAALNAPLRRNSSLAKAILGRYGAVGALEMVLDRCLRRGHAIMVTQSSGKVYVAQVSSTAFEESGWIRLQPVFSGYRDDQQKFVITTDYTWTLSLESGAGRETSDDGSFREDFVVLVKIDTIDSVHPYDLKASYEKEFAYSQTPLADAVANDSEAGLDPKADAKNPSGAVYYVPDWVHGPLAWDPPKVAEYERFIREVEDVARYPGGRPKWYRIQERFQRHLYKVYAASILVLPVAMALTGPSEVLAVSVVGLIAFLATAIHSRHLTA